MIYLNEPILFFALSFLLTMEVYIIYKLKRIKLKDKTRYRFCQIRRDLIRLIHEKKLPVDSLTFSAFYGFSSDIIHYIDDYNFDSADFINMISARPSSSELKKIDKTVKEIKEYDEEVLRTILEFCDSFNKSLIENCCILRVLMTNKRIYYFFKTVFTFLGDKFKNLKTIKKFRLQFHLADDVLKLQQAFA